MCYVILGVGKCVWFLLVYVVGVLGEVFFEVFDGVSCVVEMIYVYLFVYDDMLCMDDDDLCCGCLIVYCVYDEVIVLLVGDVLQMQVFIVLVELGVVSQVMCVVLVVELVCVFGLFGMVGGQVIDL